MNLDDNAHRHTVVLTADYAPIEVESGKYWLPVYDPNAPMATTRLTNPDEFYLRGISGLFLDTNNGNWSLYFNGGVFTGNDTPFGIQVPFTTVDCYDVSLLESSFFTQKLTCDLNYIKLW